MPPSQNQQAVGILKNNPAFLHKKELGFFRDYLHSFGATIPSLESIEEAEAQKSADPKGKAAAEAAGIRPPMPPSFIAPINAVAGIFPARLRIGAAPANRDRLFGGKMP